MSKRTLASVLGLLVLLSIPGCASESEGTDDEHVTDDELRSEQESFANLDVTNAELAKVAEDSKVFDDEFTLYAIAAPKLVGLS